MNSRTGNKVETVELLIPSMAVNVKASGKEDKDSTGWMKSGKKINKNTSKMMMRLN